MSAYNESELKIPVQTLMDLAKYIDEGFVPGKFLRAVINNDLQAAVNEASELELNVLSIIVKYMHERAPSGCHGYSGAVKVWSKRFNKEREIV